MKDYKDFEEYSQIVPKEQLTMIKGGSPITFMIIDKLAEWSVIINEKINDYFKSKL
ncbi:MAG: hypothetical protein KAS71_13430 [Bacteroidales bacterium]|nr:hypothetical protein [Bacteroidales bacterium]